MSVGSMTSVKSVGNVTADLNKNKRSFILKTVKEFNESIDSWREQLYEVYHQSGRSQEFIKLALLFCLEFNKDNYKRTFFLRGLKKYAESHNGWLTEKQYLVLRSIFDDIADKFGWFDEF